MKIIDGVLHVDKGPPSEEGTQHIVPVSNDVANKILHDLQQERDKLKADRLESEDTNLKQLQKIAKLEIQLTDICCVRHDYQSPKKPLETLFAEENTLTCTRCGKKTKEIPF